MEKRQLAERNRAQALSPQVTGMSDQSSIMDDLHARLKMHGTPRAKRHERRRAELPRAPTFGSLDLGDLSLDAYATATRNLLKDLRQANDEEGEEAEVPTRRRAGRRSHQPSTLTDELFFMAAQGMSTPRNDEVDLGSEREEADEEMADDKLEHGMLGLSVATDAGGEANSNVANDAHPDDGNRA